MLKILTVVCISAIFLSGCGDKMENDFMAGCKQGGTPKDVCHCSYKKMEKQFSNDELKSLFTDQASPNLQKRFINQTFENVKICMIEHYQ